MIVPLTVCAGGRINDAILLALPKAARLPPHARRRHSGLVSGKETPMFALHRLRKEEGSDIAEYAVTLAMILVMVVGTVRLMGGNIQAVFSQVSQVFNGPVHAD
jgi:Flp pilus assembly pilin Flp